MEKDFVKILAGAYAEATATLYPRPEGAPAFTPEKDMQKTRRDFRGDFTMVVFSHTARSRKSPEETGKEIGGMMQGLIPEIISGFNVIKGFLNIELHQKCWIDFAVEASADGSYGLQSPGRQEAPVLLEFSSPNTNKPLHLGHIRNNLLGWSLARILEACGRQVKKVNLVNDRGIHICKSMLAWKKWGNEETPESSGLKGDKLVGKYYVIFEQYYRQEMNDLIAGGMKEDEAAAEAPLMKEARLMLKLWEEGDTEVRDLWKRMNAWVYKGFDETYAELGISFDKVFYESDTWLLGKEIVQQGLADNKLYAKEDTSVWVDLRDDGLDEKLLLRSDGTSVYMTQDIGTAALRYEEFRPSKMVYVVGNEQNYHFEVLAKVMKKLGFEWADSIFHLSYGMVELPDGKMKSREGKVVDADDLLSEMFLRAGQTTEELGKSEGLSEEVFSGLCKTIGLGALKYFILKVDPKKNMLFNPEESIDFNGNTGPFIQYTHARILSLLGKAGTVEPAGLTDAEISVLPEEHDILRLCYEFPAVVKQAGDEYSPALIANYIFELAQVYNTFYQRIPVLKETDPAVKQFRLMISQLAGQVLKNGLGLLGIEAPERM